MQAHPTTDLESSLLRSPKASEGEGGAISETQARERGRMVKVADQVAELAAENGLQVSESIKNSLLPTPAVAHVRNHDEPIEDYLARRQKMTDGIYKGMPGVSLGVAVRMEMLPTPQALEGHHGNNLSVEYRESQGRQVMLSNYAVDFVNAEVTLLPTVTVQDGKNTAGKSQFERNTLPLNAEVTLLPTTTTNGNERKGPGYSSAGILQELEIANGILPKEYSDWTQAAKKTKSIPTQKSEKTSLDETMTWGKFEPAIQRWEALTRPAPAPTKPDGKDGNHRLSADFTEWMMGLPEGWVTAEDIGLKRNDQLKACGNGVVPQQAELALRMLLQDITI
jgi:hypothetical protein